MLQVRASAVSVAGLQTLRDPPGKGLATAIASGPRRRYPLALVPRFHPGARESGPSGARLHDRRDHPAVGAPPLRLGQPDPAARPDHADLGGPFDRRASGGRPDRPDDLDLHALGGRARADPRRRAAGAAPRLAGAARPLALSDGDGHGRLHRLRRALLCRRASHQRAQPFDHPGRNPGARPARRAAVPRPQVHRASGARRLRHHARRRR